MKVKQGRTFQRSTVPGALIVALAGLSIALAVHAQPDTFTFYFGNMHAHTSYSDGLGMPQEAYAFARTSAHLDFLVTSEHNHVQAELGAKERADGLLIAADHDLYEKLIAAGDEATEDGKFVALYGQEFSTRLWDQGFTGTETLVTERLLQSQGPKPDLA